MTYHQLMDIQKRSHWLFEAIAKDETSCPMLCGSGRADVCIVGGGYAGLWTAIILKDRQPNLDIAVVEAELCGSGASGRNGGMVATWWAKFQSLVKICGVDEALRLAKSTESAVTEIGQFCERHDVDANFRYDGWLWTATSPAQLGAWNSLVSSLDQHGVHPFQELSSAEVASRSGSKRHIAGVFERSGATVQPAILARGLRRVALSRGVRIYENSPMIKLDREAPIRVITKHGDLKAEKIVIAMNAWATKFRELRRKIVVVGSDIILTSPIPEKLQKSGWSNGLAISDSRVLLNYYRTTADGRIAYGTGGGTLSFANHVGRQYVGTSPRRSFVEQRFRAVYPDFKDVLIDKSWTGPIDRTMMGLPLFGHLGGHRNILYGVGFSGNGVGPTRVGAKILSSLVLDAQDEWSECKLVQAEQQKFPPEPIRYIGGQLVLFANRRKEKAENADRNTDTVTKYIASLAPAGYVPVKGVAQKSK